MKASIAVAHPGGAMLVLNTPVGWLQDRSPGGLLYGWLLWSDNAWSDFVLRLGSGLAHPDARTVAELGFAEATGILQSLAAYQIGLEPHDAEVRLLRSADGWLLPLASPV